MSLPTELIDAIILHTDFQTSVTLGNEYTSFKFYIPIIHTWNWAAENGYINVIKWLHQYNIGQMMYLKTIIQKLNGWQTCRITQNSTKLVEFGCKPSTMDIAANNGHLDIVCFLSENRR
jgi:hypothetical protein